MEKQQSTLKLISWNVNGIRAAVNKGVFQSFIKEHNPDILCLQETKAEQHQAAIDLPEYEEYWYSANKKGYSGTAIFTKVIPLTVRNGFPPELLHTFNCTDEVGRDAADEGRVITAEYESFFLVTVYTPNSKDDLSRLAFRYKQWDPIFLQYVTDLQKTKPVIFCGDLNVAHQEIDLARPKENVGKHGFTHEEREGFENFLRAGFIDTFRYLHPDEPDHYTWWTHWANARARNVGWRIDYVLVSDTLKHTINDVFILPEILGSDHCPVGITVAL